MNTIEIINENGETIYLEEAEFNANYEPTQEEVIQYAIYLGMDPNLHQQYFQIAYEGLKAPLLNPWKACKTNDGQIYYINQSTHEAIVEHPLDQYYRNQFQLQLQQDLQKSNLNKDQKSKKIQNNDFNQNAFQSQQQQQAQMMAQSKKNQKKPTKFLQDQLNTLIDNNSNVLGSLNNTKVPISSQQSSKVSQKQIGQSKNQNFASGTVKNLMKNRELAEKMYNNDKFNDQILKDSFKQSKNTFNDKNDQNLTGSMVDEFNFQDIDANSEDMNEELNQILNMTSDQELNKYELDEFESIEEEYNKKMMDYQNKLSESLVSQQLQTKSLIKSKKSDLDKQTESQLDEVKKLLQQQKQRASQIQEIRRLKQKLQKENDGHLQKQILQMKQEVKKQNIDIEHKISLQQQQQLLAIEKEQQQELKLFQNQLEELKSFQKQKKLAQFNQQCEQIQLDFEKQKVQLFQSIQSQKNKDFELYVKKLDLEIQSQLDQNRQYQLELLLDEKQRKNNITDIYLKKFELDKQKFSEGVEHELKVFEQQQRDQIDEALQLDYKKNLEKQKRRSSNEQEQSKQQLVQENEKQLQHYINLTKKKYLVKLNEDKERMKEVFLQKTNLQNQETVEEAKKKFEQKKLGLYNEIEIIKKENAGIQKIIDELAQEKDFGSVEIQQQQKKHMEKQVIPSSNLNSIFKPQGLSSLASDENIKVVNPNKKLFLFETEATQTTQGKIKNYTGYLSPQNQSDFQPQQDHTDILFRLIQDVQYIKEQISKSNYQKTKKQNLDELIIEDIPSDISMESEDQEFQQIQMKKQKQTQSKENKKSSSLIKAINDKWESIILREKGQLQQAVQSLKSKMIFFNHQSQNLKGFIDNYRYEKEVFLDNGQLPEIKGTALHKMYQNLLQIQTQLTSSKTMLLKRNMQLNQKALQLHQIEKNLALMKKFRLTDHDSLQHQYNEYKKISFDFESDNISTIKVLESANIQIQIQNQLNTGLPQNQKDYNQSMFNQNNYLQDSINEIENIQYINPLYDNSAVSQFNRQPTHFQETQTTNMGSNLQHQFGKTQQSINQSPLKLRQTNQELEYKKLRLSIAKTQPYTFEGRAKDQQILFDDFKMSYQQSQFNEQLTQSTLPQMSNKAGQLSMTRSLFFNNKNEFDIDKYIQLKNQLKPPQQNYDTNKLKNVFFNQSQWLANLKQDLNSGAFKNQTRINIMIN